VFLFSPSRSHCSASHLELFFEVKPHLAGVLSRIFDDGLLRSPWPGSLLLPLLRSMPTLLGFLFEFQAVRLSIGVPDFFTFEIEPPPPPCAVSPPANPFFQLVTVFLSHLLSSPAPLILPVLSYPTPITLQAILLGQTPSEGRFSRSTLSHFSEYPCFYT